MKPQYAFGDMLDMLKHNKKCAREGWNGKGMFIYYVPAASYPATSKVAKEYWGNEGVVPYHAYIAMKTASGEVVPWLASQTDILAEDWQVA
jgi:Protein of unknown function (DUF2829)